LSAVAGSTKAEAATIVCSGASSSACYNKTSHVACSGQYIGQVIDNVTTDANFGDPSPAGCLLL